MLCPLGPMGPRPSTVQPRSHTLLTLNSTCACIYTDWFHLPTTHQLTRQPPLSIPPLAPGGAMCTTGWPCWALLPQCCWCPSMHSPNPELSKITLSPVEQACTPTYFHP